MNKYESVYKDTQLHEYDFYDDCKGLNLIDPIKNHQVNHLVPLVPFYPALRCMHLYTKQQFFGVIIWFRIQFHTPSQIIIRL